MNPSNKWSRSGLETSSGHNCIELLLADEAVIIRISTLDHFLQFRVIDVLSDFLHHSSQIFYRNKPGFLIIEEGENPL
jgi:hypothetical protein